MIRLRSYATMLVPLMIVTTSRAMRIAEAMEARAFGYKRENRLQKTGDEYLRLCSNSSFGEYHDVAPPDLHLILNPLFLKQGVTPSGTAYTFVKQMG